MDPERVGRCGHDIDSLLHKRADGRLSDQEAVALERQTAACVACRERADLLESALDALRRDQRVVPAALPERVMRRLRPLAPARRAAFVPLLVRRWLPAAAVLVAGLGAVVLFHGRRGPVDTSSRISVQLQLDDAKATSVAVAGDFNGWDAAAMEKGEDGVFRVQLEIARGRYQYAFLVDGRTWVPDPRAATTVASGYGGWDSILDLTL